MKKLRLPFAFALLALVGIALLAPKGPGSSASTPSLDKSALMGGGLEMPGARRNWELRRLADPATGKIPPGIRSLELAFAETLPSDAYLKTDSLTVPWTLRGPWNLGGRTRAFAMDVTNPNVLLAGGVSGGIWRSVDAGTSWTRITLPGAHPGVNSIAQDTRPGHTNTWYALSGEAYGTSASGGSAFYLGTGLSKSVDGGLTWSVLSATNSNTPQTFDNVWDATWNVAVNPADTVNDVVYAALIGAIMRSTNGGTSWTRVRGSSTSNLSYFTNVMCTPTGKVYTTLSSYDGGGTHLGTNKGIWRSVDGTTWANISPPFMPTTYRRIVSAYNPLDENRIYFLAAGTGTQGKMTTDFRGTPEWNSLWRYTYLSGDGSGSGGVWEDLSVNIPATGGPFDKFVVQGSYNLVTAVHPVDTNLVLIGGTNIYRSTTAFNDSLNSKHIGGYEVGAGTPVLYNGLYPNQHPDHHVLFFDPAQPNVLYNANDGGLFRTDDVTDTNVAWTPLNNGYHVSQFYTVAMDHGTSGSDVIVGGLQDNGSWFNNTSTATDPWKWVAGGDGAYCHVTSGAGYYYFSKQLGVIAKCQVDAAGTVTAFERIDPIGASGYEFINPFVLDPNNENVMYVPAGRHIWRNSDLSAIPLNGGWDSISTNWTALPDTVLGSAQITAIAASKTPANRIYIGTDSKSIFRIDNANSPTPTMTLVSATAMPGSGFVSCIAVHPDNGDELFAVFSNYGVYSLWRSVDAGATWAKAGGNLEQTSTGSGTGPSVRWLRILPFAGGDYYLAGTSTGLYGTDSISGTTTVWTQLAANSIGKSVVNMIDHRSSDGMTLVATHGYGIWSATFTGPPPVGGLPVAGVTSPMVSVYPNPLNEASRLRVELPADDRIKVRLIGMDGRQVAAIEAMEARQGLSEYTMPDLNLAAGTYFVRVEGKDWSKVLKVVKR